MTGFPGVPSTRGETDDDASIHLYSRVGPARPVHESNYDKQILSILNRSNLEAHPRQKSVMELNENFDEFFHIRQSDTESECTVIEEDAFSISTDKSLKEKAMPSESVSKNVHFLKWPLILVGFVVGASIIVLSNMWDGKDTIFGLLINSKGVNSRLGLAEEGIGALHTLINALNDQIDVIETRHDQSMTIFASEVDKIGGEMSKFKDSTSQDFDRFRALVSKVVELEKCLEGLAIVAEPPKDFMKRVAEIYENVSQISNTQDFCRGLKREIVDEIISDLSKHVPIYIKNSKIHYIPEFHKFLGSFISNNTFPVPQDWKTFFKDNEHEFLAYLQGYPGTSVTSVSNPEAGEIFSNKSTKESHESGSKLAKSMQSNFFEESQIKGNEIAPDAFLKPISRETIDINYADYNLGARILGFLTSAGTDSDRRGTFMRTIFLGWYDYMSSHGLHSSSQARHNANNVLFDGGDYWQCGAARCSVGVRLSHSIILTEVIVSVPFPEIPEHLNSPTSISIYFRPKRKLGAANHVKLLSYSRREMPASDNRYMEKFYRVTDAKLEGDLNIWKLRLPSEIVNMNIPTRDLVVQVESAHGNTGIDYIMVHGITDLGIGENFQQEGSNLGSNSHVIQHSKSEVEDNWRAGYTLEDDDYV